MESVTNLTAMQDNPGQQRIFGHPGLAWAALILALAMVALFARLGHYALWDDEAGTALSAVGIWRTGDTTALLDHNIVAYESGKDLRNLHERMMPPLPGYLAAPFIGLLGRNSWAARLPFALCGAACVGLMLWWLLRSGATSGSVVFFGVALLANASFFLFFRQCRYYGPAILCSVAMAWIYVRYDGRRWQVISFSAFSLCLFASNYLNWAAFGLCLALDYACWGRKQLRLKPSDWVILALPTAVVGGAILMVWNPLAILGSSEKCPEVGKLQHLWWCARDITACEFGAPILILLGLALCFTGVARNPWLLRGCIAWLLYLVAVSLLEQRPPSLRGVAFVRYFAPIIPLSIAISVMTLTALYQRSKWWAIALACVVISTNLLNGGGLLSTGWQSTPLKFVKELIHPPGDPFAVTAKWIEENVAGQASVWVVPDYATYPLMYHAPKPVYAWQLTWPPAKEEFKQLPPVHFIGQVAPDYIVAFGPATRLAQDSIASWNRPEVQYALIHTIDFFWKDAHRPELFWRTFEPITAYDRNTEAIYIFKLQQGKGT